MGKGTFVASTLAGLGIAAASVFAWQAWKLHKSHAEVSNEASSLRTTLSDEKKRLESCTSELSTTKSLHEAAANAATSASASLTASQSELEELRKQRAEAEARLAAFKAMTEKFRKMIDAGKLSVVLRNGRMVVKLPAGVLFASGSADLSKEGQSALTDVAHILRQFPDRKFMVAGHTDNVPVVSAAFKNNWELSTARAVNVTLHLVASGMNASRLVAAGYAEHDPVKSNASEAGRHENRRIEIVLLPNLSELPQLPPDPNAPPASSATVKK